MKRLALVLALVVGLLFRAELSPHGASNPVVCSGDRQSPGDALKVGERREPRVFPAPLLDRLPPVPLPSTIGRSSIADEATVPGALAFGSDSYGDRPPIVKHVPRMERGDPPRI